MISTEKPTRRAPRQRAGVAANAARGEHRLTLAGVTYRLRPSYSAVAEIEEELGRCALELARDANAMKLTYRDLGIILAPLISAGADKDDHMTRAVNADRLAELVFEEGMSGVMAAVLVVLLDVVGGGRTASGEVHSSGEVQAVTH